jgi:hypothetical protein
MNAAESAFNTGVLRGRVFEEMGECRYQKSVEKQRQHGGVHHLLEGFVIDKRIIKIES